MNTAVTSREAILKTCREMVSTHGLAALNMRSVASACNVALGSLYNYFPSKNELVTAAVESVWQDIFHMDHPCAADLPFPDYVRWIFQSVQQGAKEYPNFFTAHSITFATKEKKEGRKAMEHYFDHMKQGMAEALEKDVRVNKNAFREGFSQQAFFDFVLSNILALLLQQAEDCELLAEIVRRTLYFT